MRLSETYETTFCVPPHNPETVGPNPTHAARKTAVFLSTTAVFYNFLRELKICHPGLGAHLAHSPKIFFCHLFPVRIIASIVPTGEILRVVLQAGERIDAGGPGADLLSDIVREGVIIAFCFRFAPEQGI